MNATKIKILKFCLDKKRDITVPEIKQALNLSQTTVQRYLHDFKKAGRIAQFEMKGRGQYKLMNPKIYFDNYLFVYKKGHLCGYLNFDKGLYKFAYDNHYLCQPEAVALSPIMELTETILESDEILHVFEQLIPEGTDRKILEKKVGSANDFDLLSLLQHIYGDLQFSKTPLKFDKHYTHQIRYTDIKDKLLGQNTFPNILEMEIHIDDKLLFPEMNELSKVSRTFLPSGLSGFQHKFSVVLKNKIIRQAKANEIAYHFIKPYHPKKANPDDDFYFPHLAINEHLFMTFAKNELGFEVPWNAIVKRPQDTEYHYIVKRFDRYNGYKLAYHEFATLIGLDSERKYQMSSDKMFKRIKKVLTLHKERLILLRYYFYSMLIVHEDMHSKNLSVRTEEGKTIRMSPLYDIATTGIYQNAYGYESHLPINGKRTNIRPKDFYVLVDLMAVKRKTFDKAASNILFNYTYKLPEYFDKLEKVFPDAKVYKKTPANYSKKQGRSQSISLAEKMRQSHRTRIKQLKKNGWYAQLNIPCHVDYPVVQTTFTL